jgi:hypothetical protein
MRGSAISHAETLKCPIEQFQPEMLMYHMKTYLEIVAPNAIRIAAPNKRAARRHARDAGGAPEDPRDSESLTTILVARGKTIILPHLLSHRAQLWPTVSSSGRPHVPSLQPSATVLALHLSIGALTVWAKSAVFHKGLVSPPITMILICSGLL